MRRAGAIDREKPYLFVAVASLSNEHGRVGGKGRGYSAAMPVRGTSTGALSPLLIEVLVCPEDKGDLLYVEAESTLYNPRLKRRYRVQEGIPVMLIDEAETVSDSEHERLTALFA
jgi:uncharacterized protein